MAIILEHPDKDFDPAKGIFEFGDFRVVIENKDHAPLTVMNCVGMLETTKMLLIDNFLNS